MQIFVQQVQLLKKGKKKKNQILLINVFSTLYLIYIQFALDFFFFIYITIKSYETR